VRDQDNNESEQPENNDDAIKIATVALQLAEQAKAHTDTEEIKRELVQLSKEMAVTRQRLDLLEAARVKGQGQSYAGKPIKDRVL
jgi:hypothetical protein